MAYFVGHDPAFPADTGFALKGWRKCTIDNEVVQLRGAMAITMGKVSFTDSKGQTTTVDKTWAFEREPDGTIKIVLHHSSLPFSG